jgi:hypothetical protein
VNNSEVETMPIFDQEVLTKLSHATLKGLCRKHNIKPGKRKAETIQKILDRSAQANQQYEKVELVKKHFCVELETKSWSNTSTLSIFLQPHRYL